MKRITKQGGGRQVEGIEVPEGMEQVQREREADRVTLNPVAAGGFSAAASTYARIRPTYARQAIGAIKGLCPSGGRVLDVAAGTGILTGQLVRSGMDVQAVEPLAAMARQFRLGLPAIRLALGVAEALPVASESVDLLAVGQAFHWFDATTALAEAARVLRANGVLVLVWNVRDESTPWVEELTGLVEDRTGGRPYDDHRETPWTEVVAASGHFSDLDVRRFPNPVPTTVEGIVERLRSTSFVAALDEHAKESLIIDARALIADHPELTGTFDYPHETALYTCRSLGRG